MRFIYAEILIKILLITSIISLLTYGSFGQQKISNQSAKSQSFCSPYKIQKITYKLFNTSNHRYGYDIFIDTELFIHQPVIPCLTGTKGFKSKNDAKKVALLVIDKIREGLIPPTVTISEMQKLRIDLR